MSSGLLVEAASISPEEPARVHTGQPVPRPSMLPAGWPVLFMLNGIFVWWALGLSLFIGPLLALPCLAHLIIRGRVRAPRTIALWFLFILWAALSATQITTFSQWGAFVYRQSWFVAGLIVYLYLVNIPKSELPSRTLVVWLTVFFGLIVVGGIVGTLVPNFSFTTPVQAILPKSLLANRFIFYNVSASTSGQKVFTTIPIYRTKAPFGYQNQWGETYAIVIAFPLAYLSLARSRLWRNVIVGLLIASIVPLVFSLDRGAWLSAAVAIGFSALVLAARNRPGRLGTLLIGGLLATAILLATPLGGYILTRLNSGYGDKHRLRLYEESVVLVKANPFIGYGAPVDFETGPGAIAAGTHGQFWTILVSQGIPGLVFFFGWYAVIFRRAFRRDRYGSPATEEMRFWSSIAILTALSQIAYYEWLLYGYVVLMVAAAIASREAPPRRIRHYRHLNGSPADVPASPGYRPPISVPFTAQASTGAAGPPMSRSPFEATGGG